MTSIDVGRPYGSYSPHRTVTHISKIDNDILDKYKDDPIVHRYLSSFLNVNKGFQLGSIRRNEDHLELYKHALLDYRVGYAISESIKMKALSLKSFLRSSKDSSTSFPLRFSAYKSSVFRRELRSVFMLS